VARLPFRELELHGFPGRRRTVSFGWRYGFARGTNQIVSVPAFAAA
jgi:hypothetical protein